jgi:hypothetical protein
MARMLIIAAALAAGLGACSKCDVPTYGWSGLAWPSACSSETPRR